MREPAYRLMTEEEKEAAREGLREGIKLALAAAQKRNYQLHPRIAALRTAR